MNLLLIKALAAVALIAALIFGWNWHNFMVKLG